MSKMHEIRGKYIVEL